MKDSQMSQLGDQGWTAMKAEIPTLNDTLYVP